MRQWNLDTSKEEMRRAQEEDKLGQGEIKKETIVAIQEQLKTEIIK